MSQHEPKIKVKAMCLLFDGDRVLVADGNSLKSKTRPIVPSDFYRVLGGSLNFNETAEEGVRREIREELNSEIENLKRLDVIENRFVYADEPGHEIVFLFSGRLARKELTAQETIHITEQDYEFDAQWIKKNELLNGKKPLYPALNYSSYLS